MRSCIYIILFCSFFSSCKKEKLPLGGLSGGNFSSLQFICDTIPPEPPTGWEDTATVGDLHITYWAYNPTNNSEIIYVDGLGNLITYNLKTQSKKFLDNGIMGLPAINNSNWVTYGKLNFCSYIIKTNGDSLKQINASMSAQTPKWDYTGNYIYYFQEDINPYRVIKVSKSGIKVDSIPAPSGSHMCFAKTSDKYVDQIGTSLYLFDPLTSQQTFLTNYVGNHMCFDKDDKNIIWWNHFKGLVRFNLESKKIDTLVSFCENFMVSGLNVSPNSNKLTMAHYQYKQVGSWWKLHKKVDPIEYDLVSKKWSKLIIKP